MDSASHPLSNRIGTRYNFFAVHRKRASVKVFKKTTGGGTCTNAWDSGAIYTSGDQVTQGGKV